MIASPCIKVCLLDASRQSCLGCFRTVEEITSWGRMTDAERAALLEVLAGRRARRQVKIE